MDIVDARLGLGILDVHVAVLVGTVLVLEEHIAVVVVDFGDDVTAVLAEQLVLLHRLETTVGVDGVVGRTPIGVGTVGEFALLQELLLVNLVNNLSVVHVNVPTPDVVGVVRLLDVEE